MLVNDDISAIGMVKYYPIDINIARKENNGINSES
jgi:hypothetical protein